MFLLGLHNLIKIKVVIKFISSIFAGPILGLMMMARVSDIEHTNANLLLFVCLGTSFMMTILLLKELVRRISPALLVLWSMILAYVVFDESIALLVVASVSALLGLMGVFTDIDKRKPVKLSLYACYLIVVGATAWFGSTGNDSFIVTLSLNEFDGTINPLRAFGFGVVVAIVTMNLSILASFIRGKNETTYEYRQRVKLFLSSYRKSPHPHEPFVLLAALIFLLMSHFMLHLTDDVVIAILAICGSFLMDKTVSLPKTTNTSGTNGYRRV